eukprot:gene43229-53661_t
MAVALPLNIVACKMQTFWTRLELLELRDALHTSISHSEYLAARDAADESGVDHFFDKLLRIQDKMLTATGRRMAKERQAYMIAYLRQLDAEMEDSCDPDAGKITSALKQLEKVVE